MANKYSHALVLSQYERRGLIDFDQLHYSQPPAFEPSRPSTRSEKSIAQSSIPVHGSLRPNLKGRVRIGSPSPPPSKAAAPPLRRRGSSIETQIYAPTRSPSPQHRQEFQQSSSIEARDSFVQPRTSSRPPMVHNGDHYAPPRTPSRPSNVHHDGQSATADIFDLYNSPSPTSQTDWSHSSAVKALRRASWAPRPSTPNGTSPGGRSGLLRSPRKFFPDEGHLPPPRLHPHGNAWLEAQVYAPRHPPSPPATPESDESFSLITQGERCEEQPQLPPPFPEPSSRRTPPRSSSTHRPTALPSLQIQPESAGVRVAPAAHSPTSSMTTRKSSLDASATSQIFQDHSQHQPEPLRSRAPSVHRSPTSSMTTRKSTTSSESGQPQSEPRRRRASTAVHSPNISINTRTSSLKAITSPPDFSRINSMPLSVFENDDDADLESLPSSLDFEITLWADEDADPAVFSNTRPVTEPLSMLSTRASSFDSVAPPPIRLRESLIPTFAEKQLPKTAKKGLSSMLFSRLGAKAVPYSQTAPRQPPIPGSVSRTAAPSIPALFPGYKGQSPPPEEEGKRSGRRTRDSSTSTQVLGRSVPPKGTADKRRSWFKTNQMNRILGRGQPVIERNIHDIIKANQTVIAG